MSPYFRLFYFFGLIYFCTSPYFDYGAFTHYASHVLDAYKLFLVRCRAKVTNRGREDNVRKGFGQQKKANTSQLSTGTNQMNLGS